MPINFACPHCGNQTVVADQYAGTTGPCAACGQKITIPGSPYAAGLSPAPIPPKSSGGGWGTPLVIAAAAFLPLVCCIGVLVALLLPAIQAAREAARRTTCNGNLKNISLGLQNYHDTYMVFPMGAMHAGRRGSSEKIGPSWWVGTLPFMEQRGLYDNMMKLQKAGAPGNGAFNAENFNANVLGSPLVAWTPEYMRCPSSPLPEMENELGPVILPTYVGISGGCDIAMNSPDYQTGGGSINIVPPNASVTYHNRRKGAGHVPGAIVTVSGMLVPCEHTNMALCSDGTSNTMIAGEQSDWLRDANVSMSTMYHGDAGWDTNGTGPSTASTTTGGGFVSGTVESTPVPMANQGLPGSPPAAYDCYNITTVRYPPDFKRVLGASSFPGCSEDHGANNPLQSPHPGGMLVAMVDGSVQFVSGTTDLAILLRLAIRDDGQNVRLD